MDNKCLLELKQILTSAAASGIDVSELLRKVDAALGNLESKTIKIVLMGAYSDGKTSVIAGLTGHLESNMKIAIEESSDELTFYHLPALGHDFEIVDTPGLFGSKEKEIEGRQVRYSDITREYISQAHIVIYVTNASNPLKDSHKEILQYTLKDLNKLSSTIFVINKMDDAGYELTDPQDFANGEKIKTNTFKSRLNDVLKLTPKELESLNVICVAANPNAKGLDMWFKHMERYLERSRIGKLRNAVQKIATDSDKESLSQSANSSIITDLSRLSAAEFKKSIKEMEANIKKLADIEDETAIKLGELRKTALANKRMLMDELQNLQFEIETNVSNVDMRNFNAIVTKYFGENGERLDRTINQIFSSYAEKNNAAFRESQISQNFEKMSDLTSELMKSTSTFLKHTKIGADTVKGIRNTLASGFKFKPWQAVKWGKYLTKTLAYIGVAIDIFLAWKKHKQEKDFLKAKQDIIKGTKDTFASIEGDFLKDEQTYFDNFAPRIAVAENSLSKIRKDINEFRACKELIQSLYDKVFAWSNATSASASSNDVSY